MNDRINVIKVPIEGSSLWAVEQTIDLGLGFFHVKTFGYFDTEDRAKWVAIQLERRQEPLLLKEEYKDERPRPRSRD